MQLSARSCSFHPFAAQQCPHKSRRTIEVRCSSAPAPEEGGCFAPACASRRSTLLLATLAAGSIAAPDLEMSSYSGSTVALMVFKDSNDITKSVVRPELGSTDALVMMMDARGMLYELKDLAATPKDSRERFEARRLLPGMAKRIREVGQAAPVVAALIKGTDKETAVSELYGGSGGQQATTDGVYSAIGNVVTISGRTIRKEAQARPELSEMAIEKINELLAKVPEESVRKAEDFRAHRRAVTV